VTGGAVWWWQLRAGLRELQDGGASSERSATSQPDKKAAHL
jgi:hypothetical protein